MDEGGMLTVMTQKIVSPIFFCVLTPKYVSRCRFESFPHDRNIPVLVRYSYKCDRHYLLHVSLSIVVSRRSSSHCQVILCHVGPKEHKNKRQERQHAQCNDDDDVVFVFHYNTTTRRYGTTILPYEKVEKVMVLL